MVEQNLPVGSGPVEGESLRACLATVLERPVDGVPTAAADEGALGWTLSRWLGGLGLGLVAVANPEAFA